MKTNKTMEGRKSFLFLVLSMFVFASILFSTIPFVSSADMVASDVTLYIPQFVRNNVLNGTVEINVSIADAFANQNWTRAVVHIVSAGATANTTLFALNNSFVPSRLVMNIFMKLQMLIKACNVTHRLF